MKKLSLLCAIACPCGVIGTALLVSVSLLGTTGCGAFGMTYSLTGLTVQPQAALTCVFPGATAQYKAYGSYTEGGHMTKIKDISGQVKWTASLPELAKVDTSGLATAAANYIGTTAIVASAQGEFGVLISSSDLKVSTACVSSALAVPHELTIVPAQKTLSIGDGLEPLAIPSAGSGGGTTDLSGQSGWRSSDPRVATVDVHGVIRAVGPGDAIVTAVAGNASATMAIHVSGSAEDQ